MGSNHSTATIIICDCYADTMRCKLTIAAVDLRIFTLICKNQNTMQEMCDRLQPGYKITFDYEFGVYNNIVSDIKILKKTHTVRNKCKDIKIIDTVETQNDKDLNVNP